MSTSMATDVCIQCGESRASVKRNEYICGIMSGGEYQELDHEFPSHRWADWNDRELARSGIKSEAFARHRRTLALHLQWVACEDLVRGHLPAQPKDVEGEWPFASRVGECLSCGQCTICGHRPGWPRTPHPDPCSTGWCMT